MRSFRQVQFSNSNYVCYSYGRTSGASTPIYKIVKRSNKAVVHSGKRKHIVEMWNTRYATPYSFTAN
jgi:hypothetical protein